MPIDHTIPIMELMETLIVIVQRERTHENAN